MAIVKSIRPKSYFKRYQVKYRRRREGKTDYGSRRMMVKQDKNKYDTKKYRMVVRHTNKRILAQLIYSTLEGDKVLCQADSTELPRFGVKAGLKNYAAAYCVGLLLARRVLKQLKLDGQFVGKKEASGEEFHVEEADGRRPFKCVLDLGLVRTTVGNRVFGALKGACDGGLDIPHSIKRFPGFEAGEGKEDGKYDAKTHKERIMGKHIAEYMKLLHKEDAEKYEAHFADFVKAGITGEKVEAMYKAAHAAIRADPTFKPKEVKKVTNTRVGHTIKTNHGREYTRHAKYPASLRKARVIAKIKNAQAAALAN